MIPLGGGHCIIIAFICIFFLRSPNTESISRKKNIFSGYILCQKICSESQNFSFKSNNKSEHVFDHYCSKMKIRLITTKHRFLQQQQIERLYKK